MPAVRSPAVGEERVLHAPSASASAASAPKRSIRLWRGGCGVVRVPILAASVGDEAVSATIIARRLDLAGHAVDAVDGAQEPGLRIGGIGKAVIRPRQVLLRD